MFKLMYNIDFELMSFIFSIMLFFGTRVSYPKDNVKNCLFRKMTLMVIFTEAFDIASAISNTYSGECPLILNTILNGGYFMCGLALCFTFHYYIENAIIPQNGKSVLMKFNKVLIAILELSVVVNFIFGYYFYFSQDGIYQHGPLYLVLHVASCWFVLCASIIS